MSDLTALVIAGVLLALNFFFVAAEFALISARRTQVEPLALGGSRRARITLRAMEDVSLMMAAAQLGITICSLGLGAIGEPAVAHLLEPVFDGVGLPDALVYPVAFTIALAVVVGMHVVVGEMVPKNLAIAGPERAALLLAPLLVLVVAGLKPLVVGLNVTANGILRLLRVEPKDEVSSSFTREEVAGFVEASRREGLLDADEYDRVAGALGFIERSVSSVMLPSATLAVVRRESTVADVERLCTETGFSRFPVGERGGDGAVLDLVGYLHIKDVLETDPEKRARPIADKWIRPLASVQPADKLHVALTVMRAKGSHLARVVAEDGTALGVVALEDVLEELVGEIREAETAGETSRPGAQ